MTCRNAGAFFLLGCLCGLALCGCEGSLVIDTQSLLRPTLLRSEVVGIVAGFGTTFAAVPDLVAMIRRRSTQGMNPTMAAIMGVFQILWIWYGLLIVSRPVVLWNMIAVLTNSFTVGAYLYFSRRERRVAMQEARSGDQRVSSTH